MDAIIVMSTKLDMYTHNHTWTYYIRDLKSKAHPMECRFLTHVFKYTGQSDVVQYCRENMMGLDRDIYMPFDEFISSQTPVYIDKNICNLKNK